MIRFDTPTIVSTHSRPKAAGYLNDVGLFGDYCFNTQPPEGGWLAINPTCGTIVKVSTHSRPKAAGFSAEWAQSITVVSTHSRPKAAGVKWRRAKYDILFQHTAARRRLGISESAYRRMGRVSTHSRPKAAGPGESQKLQSIASFNTQPPEGGWEEETETVVFDKWFQHTAARRRLGAQALAAKFEQKFQHTAARRRLGTRSKR